MEAHGFKFLQHQEIYVLVVAQRTFDDKLPIGRLKASYIPRDVFY